MILSKKHKIFADHFIKTGDQTEAYMLANPGAKRTSAQASSYKWLKSAKINLYIQERQGEINKITNDRISEELVAKGVVGLLTAAHKREILAKIANGEHEIEEYIVIRGEVKKIKRKPNANEIAKAIEIDNRMTGDEYRPGVEVENALKIEGKKAVIVQRFLGLV